VADAIAPTGSAGPSSQRKQCSKCGYRNYLSATSCWQCFAPMPMAGPGEPALMATSVVGKSMGGPGSPFPPPPPGPLASQWGPGQWAPPSSSVSAKQGWDGARVGAIIVAIVVALGAAYGAFKITHGGSHIAMPDSLVGINKITTPAAQQAVGTIQAAATKRGWEADVAIYGYSEIKPTLVVLTIASHVSETPQELMSDFTSSAVDPSNRFQLNLLSISQQTRDGASFICAPVLTGTPTSVCVWKDDRVYGFVAERGLSMPPMDLTAAVRTALEG